MVRLCLEKNLTRPIDPYVRLLYAIFGLEPPLWEFPLKYEIVNLLRCTDCGVVIGFDYGAFCYRCRHAYRNKSEEKKRQHNIRTKRWLRTHLERAGVMQRRATTKYKEKIAAASKGLNQKPFCCEIVEVPS